MAELVKGNGSRLSSERYERGTASDQRDSGPALHRKMFAQKHDADDSDGLVVA